MDDHRPVPYVEVLNFLGATGRSTTCSACGTSNNWDFIVDDSKGENTLMMIINFPAQTGTRAGMMRYVSIECGTCRHSEFIQARHILDFIDTQRMGREHE